MDLEGNIASFSPSNNIPWGVLVSYKVVLSPILSYSYLPAFAHSQLLQARNPISEFLLKMLFRLKPVFEDKYNYSPATNNID